MASGQKLTMSQIAYDLGPWEDLKLGEKKENGGGVLIYLLLAPMMYHGGRNLMGEKALVVSSMAGEQKLTVYQIADDSGHERIWNLEEKKEDDENVSFYLLLASGMYHGGWNLLGKKEGVFHRSAEETFTKKARTLGAKPIPHRTQQIFWRAVSTHRAVQLATVSLKCLGAQEQVVDEWIDEGRPNCSSGWRILQNWVACLRQSTTRCYVPWCILLL